MISESDKTHGSAKPLGEVATEGLRAELGRVRMLLNRAYDSMMIRDTDSPLGAEIEAYWRENNETNWP